MQAALFGDFDARRLARTTDPVTSKTAAHQAGELAADHCAKILADVRVHGDSTVDEIADRLGMKREQVGRRMHALVEQGLLAVVEGRTRRNASGRQVQVYREV